MSMKKRANYEHWPAPEEHDAVSHKRRAHMPRRTEGPYSSAVLGIEGYSNGEGALNNDRMWESTLNPNFNATSTSAQLTPTATRTKNFTPDALSQPELTDAVLAQFRPFKYSDVQLPDKSCSLELRFRTDAVTVILPNSEEVGVLDCKIASALRTLKHAFPIVRFEGRFDDSHDYSRDKKKNAFSELQFHIFVYGTSNFMENLGSTLSKLGFFLQEPDIPKLLTLYRNPHVLSWSEGQTTPLLTQSVTKCSTTFARELDAVLQNSTLTFPTYELHQDERVLTKMLSHQVAALNFMAFRENLPVSDGEWSLWVNTTSYSTTTFVHKITGEKRSARPWECRGGILADEMGLGKTLSILALITHFRSEARASCTIKQGPSEGLESLEGQSGATLIIAPKSTLLDWEMQIKRHIKPNVLRTHLYHGQGIHASTVHLASKDIVLTTYETVYSDANNRIGVLQSIAWFRIVLDEAHNIRNRSTKTFRSIMDLESQRRWCITGTPVQNKLEDLFALTGFLRFHPFDNEQHARRYIMEPLARQDQQGITNLRLMMKAITLRRKKDTTNPGQKKTDQLVPVTLSVAERQKYSSIRVEARNTLSRATKKSHSHVVLSSILQLRRICSHGSYQRLQLTDSRITTLSCSVCGNSFAAESRIAASHDHSLKQRSCPDCAFDKDPDDIQAAFLTNAMDDVEPSRCNFSGELSFNDMNFASPQAIDIGSKIQTVIRNLIELERPSTQHEVPVKSLVFSCWTTTLQCLESLLARNNMKCVRIDGSRSIEERKVAIRRFQSEPDLRIMLLSTGSGSVGLNLTVATHVHIVEPQWNPMVEAQAAARVDRLGQDRDVVILRYVVKDSIEEVVMARQRHKVKLAKLTLSEAPEEEEEETDMANYLMRYEAQSNENPKTMDSDSSSNLAEVPFQAKSYDVLTRS